MQLQMSWRGCVKGIRRASVLVSWSGIAALAICLAACGSNSRVQAGPVVVTINGGSASGQSLSMGVSAKAAISMSPLNDSLGAGVDWTVICGGSPVTGSVSGGACGTVSPAHTAAASPAVYTAPALVPIGKTVTITASVTSNPSATSSVIVTITAPSITIAFTSAPINSLEAGQQTTFTVLIANDTANAGASWSMTCSASQATACGSFSSDAGTTTTYTAPGSPPSGPVTITATSITDPSVSVSTQLTISKQDISISVSPTSFTVGAALSGETANLAATVVNDTSNAGVDWKVSCTSTLGNCGKITPSTSASGAAVTYTSPPTVPSDGQVTITATAKASETAGDLKAATAVATVTSAQTVSVNVSASPTLTESGTTTLTAVVTNDVSNAGVTWSVSCGTQGACGAISDASGSASVYTATYAAPSAIPSGGLVTISASPNATSPAGNPGLATIEITTVPPSVTFLEKPPSTATVNGQLNISAAVTNDTTPPGGITWTVQCSDPNSPWSCGSVAPYQTASGSTAVYTAPPVPPAGPVTIAAGATTTCGASSCGASATSTVTIAASSALTIGFVPLEPTQLQAASSGYLNVAVANDATEQGVDWQVCASGCGFFTVVPQIPPPPQSPTTPPTPAVTATTVTAWPNGLPILYTAPANPPASGATTIQASAHANSQVSTVTSVEIDTSGTGPSLQGVVRAGYLPVSGAQVALYAAAVSGYGSAATLVSPPGQNSYATTDTNGEFTIPAGYSCPQSTSEMYLVALAGKPGAAVQPNPSLALMTALGPCGTLSSTPIVLNEVTTIGSAWALSPFAANTLKTGLNPYLNVGASSGNAAGLANAFASVNNLVDISTGRPRFEVPAGNATVPYAEINTLADILNACVNSPGGQAGDGSICGTLFTLANPYRNFLTQTQYSGVPTDTLQAAFEIAQNPAFNGTGPSNILAGIDGAGLYSLVSPRSPFQPVLGAVPFDYSISLNFTGGGGVASTSGTNFFALDASGNLWITNSGTSAVSEWNNQGTPSTLSPGYTTPALVSPGPVAIDSNGYAWICGQNGLTELNFVGQEMSGSPFLGGGLTSSGCTGLAMDASSNIWATNSADISKFDPYGNPLSPAGGYTVATSPSDPTTVSLAPPIAVDDSNNVWLGVFTPIYSGFLSLAELNNASLQPNYLSPLPLAGSPSNFVNSGANLTQTQIAIDGSGNVWGGATQLSCVPGSLFKVPPYKGIGTTLSASTVPGSIGAIDPFRCSTGVAIDGSGVVWTANVGGPADPLATPPNIGAFNPALSSNTFGFVSESIANGPRSVAIDGSGNVWVLLENNTVSEFIGVATPAVTPISLAVKKKRLGAKP
jgi:hypothetical protein